MHIAAIHQAHSPLVSPDNSPPPYLEHIHSLRRIGFLYRVLFNLNITRCLVLTEPPGVGNWEIRIHYWIGF